MPRLNLKPIAALFFAVAPLAALSAPNVSPELFEKPTVAQSATSSAGNYRAPVKVDTARLFSLKPKSQLKLSLPGLDAYTVVFDEAVTYAGDVKEWRGHFEGKSDLRVVLIDAKGVTSGYLQTPKLNLKLAYDNGINWLVADTVTRPTRQPASAQPLLASLETQKTTAALPAELPAKGTYETTVNLAELSSLPENSETSISLPNAGNYRVVYEQTTTTDSGSSTWAGYLRDYGNDYRVMITYGPGGTEGQLTTPAGEFLLRTVNSKQYLVDVKRAGLTHPPANESDAIAPHEANAPPSKGSKNNTGTTQTTTPTSTPSTSATVDLLVLYTPGLATRLGANLQTRIDQIVALANQAYVDSGVAMKVRVVGRELVNYTDSTSNSTALSALYSGTDAAFSNVSTLRQKYGADLVTLIRPFNVASQISCGVAYIGGYNGQPIQNYASRAFSVVSDGTDSGGRYYCTAYSLAHEMGHNMGSMHDRATVASQGGGAGAYPYSYGYGISGAFGTVMSYISPVIGKFSNPLDNTCGGSYVCGVSESNTTASANNALSLNNTRTAVAAFRATTVAASLGITGTVTQGTTALAGVSINAPGASCTATGANGVYSCSAPQGWSGTITPTLTGYQFQPVSISLTDLQTSKSGQNFSAALAQ